MSGSGRMSTGTAPRLLQGQGKAIKNQGMVKCVNCGQKVTAANMGAHMKQHMNSDPFEYGM